MDYKKKYEEALAHAREIHRNEVEKRRDMEFIFPELKESEDERIRKHIISVLEDCWQTCKNIDYDSSRIQEDIAWLEKQGEQKPQGKSALEAIKEEKVDNQNCVKPADKVEPKFSVGDIIKITGINNGHTGFSILNTEDSYYYNWKLVENKSAWNEENERLRKTTITFLKDFAEQGYENAVECIDWLEKQGEPMEINPTEFDTRLQNLIEKFDNLPKEDLIGSLSFWMNVVQNDGTYKPDKKQSEQKPVVIIPKFRIGDNIKTTNEEPLTITKIDDKGYWSEDLLVCDFDDAAKWELVEQKPAWSEEDEDYLNALIDKMETLYFKNDSFSIDGYRVDIVVNWLKSLKEKIGG